MHEPVLLQETIEGLDVRPGQVVIDGTLGRAGHSAELMKAATRKGGGIYLIGIDRDEDAVEASTRTIAKTAELTGSKFRIFHGNFRDMDRFIALSSAESGRDRADRILLDLGVSSPQIDSSGRGFSFRNDEPLVMTMEREPRAGSFTASDIVNGWAEEDIANVVYAYGDERYARRIARAIVAERERREQTGEAPIRTTGELASIIERAVPSMYRHGRIHSATRTFQALRIAVNDELGSLKSGLNVAIESLAQGGRLAVISFHSLEDRIVKQTMREWQAVGRGEQATKRPIESTDAEMARNPRSRSAKLRVFIKKA